MSGEWQSIDKENWPRAMRWSVSRLARAIEESSAALLANECSMRAIHAHLLLVGILAARAPHHSALSLATIYETDKRGALIWEESDNKTLDR